MSDDGNPAVFVGTMLQTGDAVAVCDECLVMWCAALLNAMTGVDPTPFLQAISEQGSPDSTPAGTLAPAGVPEVLEEIPGAPTDQPPAPAPADTDDDAADPPMPSSPPDGRTPVESSQPARRNANRRNATGDSADAASEAN